MFYALANSVCPSVVKSVSPFVLVACGLHLSLFAVNLAFFQVFKNYVESRVPSVEVMILRGWFISAIVVPDYCHSVAQRNLIKINSCVSLSSGAPFFL